MQRDVLADVEQVQLSYAKGCLLYAARNVTRRSPNSIPDADPVCPGCVGEEVNNQSPRTKLIDERSRDSVLALFPSHLTR